MVYTILIAGNKPIWAIDLDGLEEWISTNNGQTVNGPYSREAAASNGLIPKQNYSVSNITVSMLKEESKAFDVSPADNSGACLDFFVIGMGTIFNEPSTNFDKNNRMAEAVNPKVKNQEVEGPIKVDPTDVVNGRIVPIDSRVGSVNSTNAQINVANTLLNIANRSKNPKSQFLFAVGPGTMIHCTFVVLDNRTPESPVFYLIHNHSVEPYQANKLDERYIGFIDYAHDRYKKNLLVRSLRHFQPGYMF